MYRRSAITTSGGVAHSAAEGNIYGDDSERKSRGELLAFTVTTLPQRMHITMQRYVRRSIGGKGNFIRANSYLGNTRCCCLTPFPVQLPVSLFYARALSTGFIHDCSCWEINVQCKYWGNQIFKRSRHPLSKDELSKDAYREGSEVIFKAVGFERQNTRGEQDNWRFVYEIYSWDFG